MNSFMGCRLFGAYRTAISIKNASVLIHSTIGCSWGTAAFHASSKTKDIRQCSSVLYEKDIVYGGRASIIKALKNMESLYDCPVVFVLTGCVAEIMEDDIDGILREAALQKPVLPVKAAGFKGDMMSGALDSLMLIINRMYKPKRKIKNSVNIMGIFSDDYRSDADIKAVKCLMGDGIYLNSVIPYDTYETILNAPEAQLNIVFRGFEPAGEYMEKKFGIPFVVVDYPYGIENSRNFIHKVYNTLGLEVKNNIFFKENDVLQKLEMVYDYIRKLYGMPVAISGDSARAGALKKFLESELGLEVEAYRDNFSQAEQNFEDQVEASNAVMVLGSSYERGLADRLNIPVLRFAYPVFDSVSIGKVSYVGFDGVPELIQDVINLIMTLDYRRNGMYENFT